MPDALLRACGTALERADTRLVAAVSGGVDSGVLLHALAGLRGVARPFSMRVLHVDHGLHPDSGAWAERVRTACAALAVELRILPVAVDRASGEGLEAAARRARYGALHGALAAGEWLLTAHHRDDQVETLLLRLLRGSGVEGLAAIAPSSRFGDGVLVRPFLDVTREDILAYAHRHGLAWVEDPANRDDAHDRNYLRWHVLPALRARWPGVDAAVARSARLHREAADLARAVATQDLRRVSRGGRVLASRLARLPEARQRNVLRELCRATGGAPPGGARLRDGLAQLLGARDDRAPRLAWPGGEIRRWRDGLYLVPADRPAPAGTVGPLRPGRPLDLGPLGGRLRLVPATAPAIRADRVAGGLRVGFRHGGERLRPAGTGHHRPLKKLLQEAGIVPWMREHVPLLYADEDLVAVGDLWIAAEWLAAPEAPGFRVRWDRHPPVA